MDFKDDIVAISTPTGMGAIALIRITGDNALIKVEPFFKSRSGTSVSDIKSHSVIYGDFTYDDETRVPRITLYSMFGVSCLVIWQLALNQTVSHPDVELSSSILL